MAGNSTLDPDNYPAATRRRRRGHTHVTASLGPSDSSDSGSDLAETTIEDDDDLQDAFAESDRAGTGEQLGARNNAGMRVAGDIEPDRIVGEEEAGLGGGLDQAEEAQLGVTDEELARRDHAPDPFRKFRRRMRDLGGRRKNDGKE
ncbi:MAG TPA: hypothetical protein VHB46_19560 [Burkholderiales bacterium]|nr:hypothetical protein [Burkholderiales bacterium]